MVRLKQEMRGEILLKALEFIKKGACEQVIFFEAMLASGYGASMGKIDAEFDKRRKIYEARDQQIKDLKMREKRLQNFLSQMKHDGLIESEDGKLVVSRKGKQKILKLKNQLPARHYQTQDQKYFTIVSFDIPEKFRRKRDWLREVVRNLDYTMIHKSVWIGHTEIPRVLIQNLEDLKILEYIEIFEISKSGSLKKKM